jgi:hypothetical protein
MECPFEKVEVFRLPPVPADYRSDRGSPTDQANGSIHLRSGKPVLTAYSDDFLDFLSGDRSNSHGIKYELTYSNPPVK